MQIDIQTRTIVPPESRPLVLRRVHFTMRRLAWFVTRTTVQFSDVNGPRGGVDQCCQVTARPLGLDPVVVTARSHDWRSALDAALRRLRHAVLRAWRRHHGTQLQRAARAGRP